MRRRDTYEIIIPGWDNRDSQNPVAERKRYDPHSRFGFLWPRAVPIGMGVGEYAMRHPISKKKPAPFDGTPQSQPTVWDARAARLLRRLLEMVRSIRAPQLKHFHEKKTRKKSENRSNVIVPLHFGHSIDPS
jgi:hypothetical protein